MAGRGQQVTINGAEGSSGINIYYDSEFREDTRLNGISFGQKFFLYNGVNIRNDQLKMNAQDIS